MFSEVRESNKSTEKNPGSSWDLNPNFLNTSQMLLPLSNHYHKCMVTTVLGFNEQVGSMIKGTLIVNQPHPASESYVAQTLVSRQTYISS